MRSISVAHWTGDSPGLDSQNGSHHGSQSSTPKVHGKIDMTSHEQDQFNVDRMNAYVPELVDLAQSRAVLVPSFNDANTADPVCARNLLIELEHAVACCLAGSAGCSDQLR